MRFGMIGDIVGKIGRKQVAHYLPQAKEEFALDFVVAMGRMQATDLDLAFLVCRSFKK